MVKQLIANVGGAVLLCRTSAFKADVKRQKKRGKDLNKLKVLIELLIKEEKIPVDYVDHPLTGNWRGYRDAHIEGDWLLIP
ncbi:type II toxin-antitoxin system YafQ family toxin [Providencia rettgeri]